MKIFISNNGGRFFNTHIGNIPMTTKERLEDYMNRYMVVDSQELLEVGGKGYTARMTELRKRGWTIELQKDNIYDTKLNHIYVCQPPMFHEVREKKTLWQSIKEWWNHANNHI